MDTRKTAEKIFVKAVESVHPDKLIRNNILWNGTGLTVYGEKLLSDEFDHIYVIGAGKASGSMAEAIEDIFGDRITEGAVIVKYGYAADLRYTKIIEAGHPVPDKNSFNATNKIIRILEKAAENDLVICLLSGGGSSLLSDHPGEMTSFDVIEINNLLIRCGADISEINTVRKHLSRVKGGRLASIAYPARLINLILSDVPGDSPDTIASGPFSPDPTTFSDALEIIKRYRLENEIPVRAMDYLKKGRDRVISETPKPGDRIFRKVTNKIIGSNKTAVDAAAHYAIGAGMETIINNYDLRGDVADVADLITAEALSCRNDLTVRKPACLIYGGETTIRVSGRGAGGRNQHLALLCAVRLKGKDRITILAGGTDGTDGTTDAAGAVVDHATLLKAASLGMSPQYYLAEFDAFNFFREAGGHIITGPTMTNVMDLVIVIVEDGT